MKKIFRILLFLLLGIFIILAGILSYVRLALPDVGPAPDITVDKSPEKVKRGEYLANSVAVCMDCHSTRDWSKYAGPMQEGTLGKGGEVFDQNAGFPGKFYSKNITPSALGNWTDGEIYRAITSGVSKNGDPLFPVMPYHRYRYMATEDVYAIIAYIRTLKPIKNEIPAATLDFPMNFIVRTIPAAAEPGVIPDTSDRVAYGKYLTNIAACGECHTKQDKGKPIEGMEFAGGFEFIMPGKYIIRSANITPDEETGIGAWSKKAFVNRFKSHADSTYVPRTIASGEYNTIMPWIMYAKMKETDLEAIYEYMRTLKPISNPVERYSNVK